MRGICNASLNIGGAAITKEADGIVAGPLGSAKVLHGSIGGYLVFSDVESREKGCRLNHNTDVSR